MQLAVKAAAVYVVALVALSFGVYSARLAYKRVRRRLRRHARDIRLAAAREISTPPGGTGRR